MSVVQKSKTTTLTHTYEKIGFLYLDYLCEQGRFVEAANKSVTILGTSKASWEHYFYKFQQQGRIQVGYLVLY